MWSIGHKPLVPLALALAALVIAACGDVGNSGPNAEAAAKSLEAIATATPSGEAVGDTGREAGAPAEVLGIIDTPNPDGLHIGFLVGELAPNFRLETPEGDSIVLSDFRGRSVFLNFWAVWCGPCRFEMPEMEKVHQELGDEITFLAVDVREPAATVIAFRELLGLTFDTVLDRDRAVANGYRVPGLPLTFLLDGDGVIRHVRLGAFLSKEDFLESLVKVGIQ
ncbi:MAG: redoxin domain-containing protein [Chloroflexi bacterium]|nr:redoxin domain-containing protein [Chloroflexota bacterium]